MTASKSVALSQELVQRTMYGGFTDYNHEEEDGVYTRPTLDCYYVHKYWKFITADLSKEEIVDLEKCKKQLENYEKLYTLFEYASDIHDALTCLETRIANNNPSNFLSVYRYVRNIEYLMRYSQNTTKLRIHSKKLSFI